ncbi:MAG: hypothetical protein ACREFE_14170 [Limisphaerales bacterium]
MPSAEFSNAQQQEFLAMITNAPPSLAWREAAIQRMVTEANFFVARLKLPTPHPILPADIPGKGLPYVFIATPWTSIVRNPWGTNIYNPNIPRNQRLRALEIGPYGEFETTNFEFDFWDGHLGDVMRLDAPGVERYARHLDELVGKPSLIDTNGAYQLAIRWLAAVDVDMAAIRKLKYTVNQLHYKPLNATNYVMLPLFYVDFGNKHYPASGNLHAFDEPLLSVEILGTTKELQELRIQDASFSRRPLLIITNALDFAHTFHPPVRRLRQLHDAAAGSYNPNTR